MDEHQTEHTEVTSTTQPRRLASVGSRRSYAEFSTQHSTSTKIGTAAIPPILVIQEGEDYFFEDDTQPPYKLIRNLGHGHSATVEMVEDVNTGSVFARKVFPICGSRGEKKHIFNNEIKVIRRLAPHHHIIHVFATYVAKREVGLILHPVADGGDLGIFLQDFKEAKAAQLVQPEKTKILESSFGCLASGLAFMHRQKIRHKDVKPQNILIHRGSIVYTDFGYSLDYSAIGRSTTTGMPNAFTRKYCAPEVSDYEPRNSKSDIFSLGCVFLEILCALYKELVLPNPGIPYHNSLKDSQLRSSLEDLNRLGMITSDMLYPRPEDRPSAEVIASKLRRYEADRFCAKCKTEKSIENGDDCNDIPESMRRYVALQAMESGKQKESSVAFGSRWSDVLSWEEADNENVLYVDSAQEYKPPSTARSWSSAASKGLRKIFPFKTKKEQPSNPQDKPYGAIGNDGLPANEAGMPYVDQDKLGKAEAIYEQVLEGEEHQEQYRNSASGLLAPVKARVTRYCFADNIFWFIIECQMEDGRHWELQRLYEDFYNLQIQLIAAFPVEAGTVKDIKRTLPFMPGLVTYVTDNISNGRRANLDEYVKNLLKLGPHITQGTLVKNFFTPHQGDNEIDPDVVTAEYKLSQTSQKTSGPSQSNSRQSSTNHLQSTTPQTAYSNASYPSQANHQRGQASISSQQPNASQHYRTQSDLSAPALMLRQGSTITQSPATSSALNGAALKIKVWFEEDSCVVIRMPLTFRFDDLYKKLKERRALEQSEERGQEELAVEYRDEIERLFYPIENDDDLAVAVARNPKLSLSVTAIP